MTSKEEYIKNYFHLLTSKKKNHSIECIRDIAIELCSRHPVTIYKNNESGPTLWVIEPLPALGLWLHGFKTKKKAVEFCEMFELEIRE